VSNTDFIVHFFDKAEVEHFLEEKTMVYINGVANNASLMEMGPITYSILLEYVPCLCLRRVSH
jgi:hypothetical protein